MSGRSTRPVVSLAAPIAAALAIAACSGGGPTPTPTTAPTVAAMTAPTAPPTAAVTVAPTVLPTVAATPTAFTSLVYGYRLTVPAGWSIGTAVFSWDGTSGVGHDDPFVDKFAGPDSLSFFAFEKPYAGSLAAWTKEEIDATAKYHGDTCLHPPEVNQPAEVAGKPGVFLAWNCGILINQVVTVQHGVAFTIVARDTQVVAATNAADRAVLDQLLSTLTFPS